MNKFVLLGLHGFQNRLFCLISWIWLRLAAEIGEKKFPLFRLASIGRIHWADIANLHQIELRLDRLENGVVDRRSCGHIIVCLQTKQTIRLPPTKSHAGNSWIAKAYSIISCYSSNNKYQSNSIRIKYSYSLVQIQIQIQIFTSIIIIMMMYFRNYQCYYCYYIFGFDSSKLCFWLCMDLYTRRSNGAGGHCNCESRNLRHRWGFNQARSSIQCYFTFQISSLHDVHQI